MPAKGCLAGQVASGGRDLLRIALGERVENSPSNDAANSETERYGDFVLFLLGALRLDVEQSDGERFLLRLKEPERGAFGGAEAVRFCLAASPDCSDAGESAAPGSTFMQWVAGRIDQAGGILHAAPVGQPVSVHELTGALFSAYEVAGGAVRLVGCTLHDQPFVRLTLLVTGGQPGNGPQVVHRFFTTQGEPVIDELRRDLHLDRVGPFSGHPPKTSPGEIGDWIAAARKTLERDSAAVGEVQAATIVWCKHAAGKLSFEIGENSVETTFRGLAQLIADGKIEPPAYECPQTGVGSHRLAATDDGRITAAEAIGVCSQSGKRVFATELETCAATQAVALSEYLVECPVSGSRVLRSALVECPTCGQLVSPAVMDAASCSACRSLTAVSKDDPRMARVLGEYPRLDAWGKWRIAETSSVYILRAGTLLRKLLAVVDKQSLEVLRLATAGRFSRTWIEAAPRQRSEMLR